MKKPTRLLAISLLASALTAGAVHAQQDIPVPPPGMPPAPPPDAMQAPARPAFTQQELDQMLAPIALYPDAMLSQVLMAATYPLEVVEAARWSRAHPSLTGDAAVRAVDAMNWDPSVKSLVAFPQVITMMDEKLDWTERLGDAFLGQETQVMDTVQGLRQRAAAAGNLRSNQQLVVQQSGPTYLIEPADPQQIYVPYYDPNLVYGAWAYPAYPPVYWAPPAYYGYVRPRPGISFWFGRGISLSVGFFFGDFDWGQRHVNVVNTRPYYYRDSPRSTTIINNNTTIVNNGNRAAPNRGAGNWQHDPAHRRGVPYREAAVRQQFSGGAPALDPRRDFRGRAAAPAAAGAGARPAALAPAPAAAAGRPGTQDKSGADRRNGAAAPGGRPGPESRGEPQRPGPAVAQPATPAQPAQPGKAGGERRDGTIARPDRGTPESRDTQRRPAAAGVQPGPQAPAAVARPAVQPRAAQPAAVQPTGQPTTVQRPRVEQQPRAFEGLGRGAEVRSQSERGHASVPVPVPAPRAAPVVAPPPRAAPAAPPPRAAPAAPPPRAAPAAAPPQRPAPPAPAPHATPAASAAPGAAPARPAGGPQDRDERRH